MIKVWLVFNLHTIDRPKEFYSKDNAKSYINSKNFPEYFYMIEVERGMS